jgi:hypothetical protein
LRFAQLVLGEHAMAARSASEAASTLEGAPEHDERRLVTALALNASATLDCEGPDAARPLLAEAKRVLADLDEESMRKLAGIDDLLAVTERRLGG